MIAAFEMSLAQHYTRVFSLSKPNLNKREEF
jgi:hypothetical protein